MGPKQIAGRHTQIMCSCKFGDAASMEGCWGQEGDASHGGGGPFFGIPPPQTKMYNKKQKQPRQRTEPGKEIHTKSVFKDLCRESVMFLTRISLC